MSNRSKLANIIAEKFDMSKKDGNAHLASVTELIKAHVKTEGEAVLPGFGRLKMQVRPARKGHNPKTGEAIDIPSKVVFKFKAFPGALE